MLSLRRRRGGSMPLASRSCDRTGPGIQRRRRARIRWRCSARSMFFTSGSAPSSKKGAVLMAEVLTIHGGTKPGEPVLEVVAALTRLLADAKAGTLRGFAYATVSGASPQEPPTTGAGWAGDACRHPLSSAIMMLQWRY